MSKSLGLVLVVWICLVSTLCFADDTGYVSITQISSWSSANLIYLTVPHGCGGTNTTQYSLARDDNQKLALLMSAFLSGLQVNLNYYCNGEYPTIVGVRVKK